MIDEFDFEHHKKALFQKRTFGWSEVFDRAKFVFSARKKFQSLLKMVPQPQNRH
jgi:hypothetical protein